MCELYNNLNDEDKKKFEYVNCKDCIGKCDIEDQCPYIGDEN